METILNNVEHSTYESTRRHKKPEIMLQNLMENVFAQNLFLASEESLPQMLGFVETQTRAKLSELGQNDEIMIFRTILVCEELCVNSIRYGFDQTQTPPAASNPLYHPPLEPSISLGLAIVRASSQNAGNELVLIYRDTAKPFNPLQTTQQNQQHLHRVQRSPGYQASPGGLGLVLINAMAEQIHYQALQTNSQQTFTNLVLANFPIGSR